MTVRGAEVTHAAAKHRGSIKDRNAQSQNQITHGNAASPDETDSKFEAVATGGLLRRKP